MKLKLNLFLMLSYLYLKGMPIKEIVTALELSSATIIKAAKNIRKKIYLYTIKNEIQIGGEGVIVEIDETKLGNRKYNRGHRVEGVWVIVGVERTSEKKKFAVEVVDRSSSTISEILLKYVKTGSIIYTDCFKSYFKSCRELGLTHFTVNHSESYVNYETGVHTNTVEGQNNAIKTLIKPRNRQKKNIKYYLNYFLWRRMVRSKVWLEFLNILNK